MSPEDHATLKRLLKALAASVVLASVFGVIGCFSGLVGITARRPPSLDDFVLKAIFQGVNVAAVSFWIVFAILFLIHVPNYFQSEAAIDWERRMKLAEEIFEREAKRRRGS